MMLKYSHVWLLAAAASTPAVLSAQSPADSAVLARLAANAIAAHVPARAADSVVLAAPRTRWDSAVVREVRALRHWPPPADTLRAWHVGPTALWFRGDRAVVQVTDCRCEPDARSRLNFWRQEQDYEYGRVGAPEDARWELVRRGATSVADGFCARSDRPETRALKSGAARC